MATSKRKSASGKKAAKSGAKKAASKKAASSKKASRKTATNYSEWFRSTKSPRTGMILLGKGVPQGILKSVEYSALDGMAIFEGDIALGTVEQLEATVSDKRFDPDSIPTAGIVSDAPMVAAVAISEPEHGVGVVGFRWPKGRVPYEIDPNLPDKSRVTKAIAHWHTKTKIRLVPRKPALASHANYVRFEDRGGCFSQVGMRGGMQIISLGSGCGVGAAIHEIGHAVGLWHEQSREDRSKFVRILFQNIVPGMEHNFNQHIVDGDDIGKYDYLSIMHYPATAFSRNGQPTIIPLKPGGIFIGQRTGLSKGDRAAIKFMYPNL